MVVRCGEREVFCTPVVGLALLVSGSVWAVGIISVSRSFFPPHVGQDGESKLELGMFLPQVR